MYPMERTVFCHEHKGTYPWTIKPSQGKYHLSQDNLHNLRLKQTVQSSVASFCRWKHHKSFYSRIIFIIQCAGSLKVWKSTRACDWSISRTISFVANSPIYCHISGLLSVLAYFYNSLSKRLIQISNDPQIQLHATRSFEHDQNSNSGSRILRRGHREVKPVFAVWNNVSSCNFTVDSITPACKIPTKDDVSLSISFGMVPNFKFLNCLMVSTCVSNLLVR